MSSLTVERHLEVVAISGVQVAEVNWLWQPFIALGKVSLLVGDPECGKTYMALALAAAVTTGTVIPLEPPIGIEGEPALESVPQRRPANVIYCSGEDDFADTLKPRFLKQRGDVNRLFGVKMIAE